MKAGEKSKVTAFDLDLRVRDRNLAKGTLEAKMIDKLLAELPDLESNTESITVEQPALGEAEGDLDVPLGSA